MFLARIEAEDGHDADRAGRLNAGLPSSLASVRSALTNVATGLDVRFVKAGTMLSHMIETIDQLVGRLDSMHEALSPDEAGTAVEELRAAARLIGELPARSASREALLNGICTTASALEKEVLATQTILKALRILSVNIRIATMDDPGFKYLVEDIVKRLSDGERVLSPLSHIIAVLMRSVRRAVDAVRQLSGEAQKVMPLVPPQLIDSADNLAAYQQHVSHSASSTSAVARAVQTKVAAVLGALQIGDTTRQRIEHVAAALQLLEQQIDASKPETGEARRIVLDLLADQLDDTAGNLGSEVTVLSGSLASISQDAHRLRLADGEDGSGSGGAVMLQGLHKSIMNVSQLTQQVRSTNAQISQIVSAVFDSLNELRERMRLVRALRADVEQIAINVRVKCHRDMGSGKAVAVIAVEVRRYSLQLHDAISAISGHLEKLAELSEGLRTENDLAQKTDISDILERSMQKIGGACDKIDAAIDQAMRDSGEALGLIDETVRDLDDHGALDDAQDSLRALIAAAKPQDVEEGSDVLAATLMAQISLSYTMARERQIHQRHAQTEAAPEHAAQDAGDDDLDGLLF